MTPRVWSNANRSRASRLVGRHVRLDANFYHAGGGGCPSGLPKAGKLIGSTSTCGLRHMLIRELWNGILAGGCNLIGSTAGPASCLDEGEAVWHASMITDKCLAGVAFS